jgi:hypothetical protein
LPRLKNRCSNRRRVERKVGEDLIANQHQVSFGAESVQVRQVISVQE